jgi:dihydrofolate reductase
MSDARPRVALVVAMDERGAIGRGGDLPWRLPDDLKRFKALTMGKPIVMGRRTWESIGGRPLPGRHNIVVTRRTDYLAPGATVVNSLDEAYAAAGNVPEVCVIGGADIFGLALPDAQVLHLTLVHTVVPDADTFFPPLDDAEWQQQAREERAADERHAYALDFVELQRR